MDFERRWASIQQTKDGSDYVSKIDCGKLLKSRKFKEMYNKFVSLMMNFHDFCN